MSPPYLLHCHHRLVMIFMFLAYYGVALFFLNTFKFPPSGMAGAAGGDSESNDVSQSLTCA